MRISDWSSDVCSSDLFLVLQAGCGSRAMYGFAGLAHTVACATHTLRSRCAVGGLAPPAYRYEFFRLGHVAGGLGPCAGGGRSEEHKSELPSLMRTSYAAFSL